MAEALSNITSQDGLHIIAEDLSPVITDHLVYIVQADGGMVMGGENGVKFVSPTSGAMVIGGEADYIRKQVLESSGGMVIGGNARIVFKFIPPPLKDWLKKRLTPVKMITDRWTDLAEAIQTFWESLFDPYFKKLYNLHSIYTADSDGQRRIIAELGDYFEQDLQEGSRAILVSMRKLELMQKDTDIPIRMAIQRMGVEGVEWLPLYAMEIDGPYGTKFYHSKTAVPNGAWLTSRGVLWVDLSKTSQGDLDKITALIPKLKPLHIVYDGQIYSDTNYYQTFHLVSQDLQNLITEDGNQLTN